MMPCSDCHWNIIGLYDRGKWNFLVLENHLLKEIGNHSPEHHGLSVTIQPKSCLIHWPITDHHPSIITRGSP